MRSHWERAIDGFDTPVASPYAVSFFTLPAHWRFTSELQGCRPAANVLSDGGFEATGDAHGWTVQEVNLDRALELAAERVSEQPFEGSRCLKLQVKPREAGLVPAALERTFLALNSPSMTLHPGSLVKISGWIRIPEPIRGSADGVLFFDSIGGEPLSVRLTEPMPWRKFTLYRRVPPSGVVNVTAALAGVGTVFFDDIRIEPLLPGDGGIAAGAPAAVISSQKR
jgi:hypothetical protein